MSTPLLSNIILKLLSVCARYDDTTPQEGAGIFRITFRLNLEVKCEIPSSVGPSGPRTSQKAIMPTKGRQYDGPGRPHTYKM